MMFTKPPKSDKKWPRLGQKKTFITQKVLQTFIKIINCCFYSGSFYIKYAPLITNELYIECA